MQISTVMHRRTPNVFHPAFQIHGRSLHAVGRIARTDGLLELTRRQRFAVTEAVKSQQRVLEKAHAEDVREVKSEVVAEVADEAANKDRQRGILLLNLLVSPSGSPDEHRYPLVSISVPILGLSIHLVSRIPSIVCFSQLRKMAEWDGTQPGGTAKHNHRIEYSGREVLVRQSQS